MRTIQRYLTKRGSILVLPAILALMALLAAQAVWAQEEEDDPCTKTGTW